MIHFCLNCTIDFFNIVQQSRSFSVKQRTMEKIMRCRFRSKVIATKRIQSILGAVLELMLSKMT